MALPTILIDSGSGSDTLASGAGPGTALTGSAAATDGTNGKTVTITDAVDLSGVATDGSAALFLNDSNVGNRNFDNISAISGSSGNWTVTVVNGFHISLSGKSWAIGGKRASLGSTSSLRLLNNNSANGDAMPGWIVEFQSAHSETLSSLTVGCYRSGDTTNGPIIVRGKSGAATRPILTFNNNGDAFNPRGNYWIFRDFEIRNSNATKTASIAFDLSSGIGNVLFKNVKISNSSNKFWQAFSGFDNSTGGIAIEDCEIGNTASVGITWTGGTPEGIRIQNNWIYSCGAQGIYWNTTQPLAGVEISGNIIAFCTNEGIKVADVTSAAISQVIIRGNIFNGNGGDGLTIASTSARTAFWALVKIENNEFTFNGGYGINFSGSGMNDTVVAAFIVTIRNNAFYTNTSGKYNGFTVTSSIGEQTDDPSGGSASSTKDYAGTTSGSNFMSSVDKALGYPIGGTLAVGTGSSSYSYVDIGLQHQDSGGGGTTILANRRLIFSRQQVIFSRRTPLISGTTTVTPVLSRRVQQTLLRPAYIRACRPVMMGTITNAPILLPPRRQIHVRAACPIVRRAPFLPTAATIVSAAKRQIHLRTFPQIRHRAILSAPPQIVIRRRQMVM
jgi:hypothetical protein